MHISEFETAFSLASSQNCFLNFQAVGQQHSIKGLQDKPWQVELQMQVWVLDFTNRNPLNTSILYLRCLGNIYSLTLY